MKDNLKDDFKKYLENSQTKHQPAWQNKGSEDSDHFGNTLEGRMSNNYISGDYPHFLKPNKIYPYRRLEDIHIKNAMEVALERYEKDLLT